MTKTPPTPPSSDIDGVHEDRHHVIHSSNDAGEGSDDLELAKKQSKGRPEETKES